MNPKVSVIVPCYNNSNTIINTLRSILNQTYKNLEIIVVDDCSIDDSFSKILSLSKTDSRIKCFRLPSNSGGPIIPRNHGLKFASGDIVCFLDSDDLWFDNKLDIQVKFMIENNCEFSYSSYTIKSKNRDEIIYVPPSYISYEGLLKLNIIGCLTVAVSKRLIEREFFDSISVEDYEYWLRILKKYNKNALSCSSSSLGMYIIQDDSRSSKKSKLIKGYLNIFKKNGSGVIYSYLMFIRYFFNFYFKYR